MKVGNEELNYRRISQVPHLQAIRIKQRELPDVEYTLVTLAELIAMGPQGRVTNDAEEINVKAQNLAKIGLKIWSATVTGVIYYAVELDEAGAAFAISYESEENIQDRLSIPLQHPDRDR